jgi:hypothetical protein
MLPFTAEVAASFATKDCASDTAISMDPAIVPVSVSKPFVVVATGLLCTGPNIGLGGGASYSVSVAVTEVLVSVCVAVCVVVMPQTAKIFTPAPFFSPRRRCDTEGPMLIEQASPMGSKLETPPQCFTPHTE